MVLNDKVYNILKWLCLLALPATAVLINVIFPAWGIPYAEPITVTINAVATFLGTCIGVSTLSYNKDLKK